MPRHHAAGRSNVLRTLLMLMLWAVCFHFHSGGGARRFRRMARHGALPLPPPRRPTLPLAPPNASLLSPDEAGRETKPSEGLLPTFPHGKLSQPGSGKSAERAGAGGLFAPLRGSTLTIGESPRFTLRPHTHEKSPTWGRFTES